MQGENFLVIGNDKRMTECKKRLNDLGYVADILYSNNKIAQISKYKSIILPVTGVIDGVISCSDIFLEELVKSVTDKHRVFYGILNKNPFGEQGVSYYNEKFIKRNSILTAQGVLKVILDNIESDLRSLKVAVVGFGNCGRAICEYLIGLDADVFIISRNAISLSTAQKLGCKSDYIQEFKRNINSYDIIINTVPVNILSEELLSDINDSCIYIEVASKPYGFDINKSQNYNFKFILANNLPGRFTPVSAGHNIADTVIEIFREEKYG